MIRELPLPKYHRHQTTWRLMLGCWVETPSPDCQCAECNRPVLSDELKERIRKFVADTFQAKERT